ncbi:MAG TPA: Gmad2 immunoglobulin-like domain-containing protein [Candidatus Paceibacterota bacterium]|nr:Gmad2 immunoglobulin-like domain-containing protein [Candidatus Paceibacterota bacterium]
MRTSLIVLGAVIVLLALGGIAMWIPKEWGNPAATPPAPATTTNVGGTVACTMEAKICPDGSSVGRVPPSCEFAPCPTAATSSTDVVIIDAPRPNATVTSPVTVTGKARGNWYFEGSFPIVVVNWDGLIIGQGVAHADGEWMTTDYVPFSASISYALASETPYARGSIILKKDNPSGLPENDDSREIPVTFSEVR